MACQTEFLSLCQITDEYRGAGTLPAWRCQLRRNTGGLRSIVRKVGGPTLGEGGVMSGSVMTERQAYA